MSVFFIIFAARKKGLPSADHLEREVEIPVCGMADIEQEKKYDSNL